MKPKQDQYDYHEIYLDKDRIARLQLPTPLTQAEKEKLMKYIDNSVGMFCVDVTSIDAGWHSQ